jgi:hypothetical protein
VASSLDCRHVAGDVGFAVKRRLPPVQVEARSHAESIGIIGVGGYAVWPANIESQWERRSGVGSVQSGYARACEDLTPGGLLSLLVTLVLEGRIVQTPGIDLPTPATFRANKHASGSKAQLHLHLGNTTLCNLASSGAL